MGSGCPKPFLLYLLRADSAQRGLIVLRSGVDLDGFSLC
ncbi:hypothetical protein SynPROS91_00821 [Synechococcus sp. PROS-9-1]|nr:hypothetical protein SynPROS91_00821 [Synechococcus sp. PROS-9-1]